MIAEPLQRLAVASLKVAAVVVETLGSLPPPRLPDAADGLRFSAAAAAMGTAQPDAADAAAAAALLAAVQATTDTSQSLDTRMAAAAPALDVLRARLPAGDARLEAVEAALAEAALAGAGAGSGAGDDDDDAAAAAVEAALAAVAGAALAELAALAPVAVDPVAAEAAAAVAQFEAELSGGAAAAAAEEEASPASFAVAEDAAAIDTPQVEALSSLPPLGTILAAAADNEEEKGPLAAAEPFAPATASKASAAAAAAAAVHVRVRCRTAPGERVVIVGGAPSLGAWDAASGVPLRWGEGHVWSGELPLPPLEEEEGGGRAGGGGPPREFKAVLVGPCGAAVWEGGPNRAVPNLSPSEGDQAPTVVEFEFAR